MSKLRPVWRRALHWTVNLLLLLAWLSTAWAFWKSSEAVPFQTKRLPAEMANWINRLSPDGSLCLAQDLWFRYFVWDVRTGESRGYFRELKDQIVDFLFISPAGQRAIIQTDREIIVWDIATMRELYSVAVKSPSIAFSPDGRTLTTASAEDKASDLAAPNSSMPRLAPCVVTLRERDTGKVRARLPIEMAWGLSYSPDGRLLAMNTGRGRPGAYRNVQLYDSETAQIVRTLQGIPMRTLSPWTSLPVFSPDGGLVAQVFDGDHLRVWDASNGGIIGTYQTRNLLGDPVFSRDGKTLAVSPRGWDNRINYWRRWIGFEAARLLFQTDTGILLLDPQTGKVKWRLPGAEHAAFLPDGRTVITFHSSREGNSFKFWNLPPQTVLHPGWAWLMLSVVAVLTAGWWRVDKAIRYLLRYASPRSPQGSSARA
jgi:WD40 repeat protein